MQEILSNKWLSLVCVLINSTFASIAYNNGDYGWALISFAFAFLCSYNFVTALKDEYND